MVEMEGGVLVRGVLHQRRRLRVTLPRPTPRGVESVEQGAQRLGVLETIPPVAG